MADLSWDGNEAVSSIAWPHSDSLKQSVLPTFHSMRTVRTLLLIALLNLIGAAALVAVRWSPQKPAFEGQAAPAKSPEPADIPERPEMNPSGLSTRQLEIARLRSLAFDIAEETLSRLPDNPGAYCLLGKLHLRSGNVEGAQQLWDHSIAIAPQFAEAYVDYGHYQLKLGAFEEAERHFRSALKHDPSLAEVRRSLGEALLAQRKYDSAVTELQSYVKDDPTSASAWCKLGYVYQQLNKSDDATQSYLNALAVDEHSSEAVNGLLVAYRQCGDEANAERYAELLTQLAQSEQERLSDRSRHDPDVIKAHEVIEFTGLTAADLLLRAGDASLAMALLEKSVAASARSRALRSKLLDLYVRSGAIDRAIDWLQDECERTADDASAWIDLGEFCIRHRRLSSAESSLRKALALEPDRAESHALLAQVQMASSDDQHSAVESAQQAVELAPVAFNYYILATAKYHVGDIGGSREALLKAIELEPTKPEYREALQRL